MGIELFALIVPMGTASFSLNGARKFGAVEDFGELLRSSRRGAVMTISPLAQEFSEALFFHPVAPESSVD
jgi:hypothetical protein